MPLRRWDSDVPQESPDPLIELGRRIRELRERRKMTIRGVAELGDFDESNLRNVEKGCNTTVATVLRLAGFLEIDPVELFRGLDPYALASRRPERLSDIEESRFRRADRMP